MTPASSAPAFIDLHAHTTESDGSYSPEQLVALAVRNGLGGLAITDHDTFAGYEQAVPHAKRAGLSLVRGIELNSRLQLAGGSDSRAAHILAYFPISEPAPEFHAWLQREREERRERNRKLAQGLQQQGVRITLSEVEARGRSLAGRAHFAQILVEKGYADSFDDAFRKYLGRGAATYVERDSLATEQIIERIRSGGGIPTVAHPVRLYLSKDEEKRALVRLKAAGLLALEVYHSDHTPELQAYYHQLARELDLLPTGGSDFHGAVKPDIELGLGFHGNVRVPLSFLEGLHAEASRLASAARSSAVPQ